MYLPRIPETIEISPNVLTFTNSENSQAEFKLRNNSDFYISFLSIPYINPQLKVIINPGNLETIRIPKPPNKSLSKVTVGWISVDYHSFPLVFPIRIVEQPQELESLECKICVRQYNDTDRIPRVIPVCGHTLCEDCAKNIIRGNTMKCPIDRRDVNVEGGASSLPRNFAILETIEERNTFLNIPMGPIDSEQIYPRIPCAENFRHESTSRCVICKANYCEPCFNKNHQGRVLSAHETIDITFPKCTNCPDKFAEMVCTCINYIFTDIVDVASEIVASETDRATQDTLEPADELPIRPSNLLVTSETIQSEETLPIDSLTPESVRFSMIDVAEVLDEVLSNLEVSNEDAPESSQRTIDSPVPESVRSSPIFPASETYDEKPVVETPILLSSSYHADSTIAEEVVEEQSPFAHPEELSQKTITDVTDVVPESSHRPIDSPAPEPVYPSMILSEPDSHPEEQPIEIPILSSCKLANSDARSIMTEEASEPEEQSPGEHSGEPSESIAPETGDSPPTQGVRSHIDHFNNIQQQTIGNKNYLKTKIAASLSAQDCTDSTPTTMVLVAQCSITAGFSENVDSAAETETCESPIDSATQEMVFESEDVDDMLSNLAPVSESRQFDRDDRSSQSSHVTDVVLESTDCPINSPTSESVRPSMISTDSETHDEEPVVETPILLFSSSDADSTMTEEVIDEQSTDKNSGEPSGLVPQETDDSSPNQGVRSRIEHLNKIEQQPIGNKNYIKTKIAASLPAQDCTDSTQTTIVLVAQCSETADFSENVDSAAEAESFESPIDTATEESVCSGAEVMDNVSEPDGGTSRSRHDVVPESSHCLNDSPAPESVRSSMIFTNSDHDEQPVEIPILSSLSSSSSGADSAIAEEVVEEQSPREHSEESSQGTTDSSPTQGVRSLIEQLNKIKQEPIGNKNYIKTKIAASLPAQDCTDNESAATNSIKTPTNDVSENGDSNRVTETESGDLETDGSVVSTSSDNSEGHHIANQLLDEPNFSPSENISKQMGTFSSSTPSEMVQEPALESNILISTQQPGADQSEALNSTPLANADTEENFKFENLLAGFKKRTQSDNGTTLNVPRPVMRAKFLVNADLAKTQNTSDSKTPDVDVNHDISETSTSSRSPQPAPQTKLVPEKSPSTVPPVLPVSSDEQTKLVSTRVAMFNNFE
ncbi:hypothetical protein CRE_24266 [Caenorhabditis remanei]|uniref:RING-type domain-containing protein n=1 Tax=Caenorhabditis remanei TaxID=31234 RepID=E3NHQ0_CAERE|nr:hypothetical protein CRE_24266 [Caenorhabditis remanei]